MLSSSQAKSLLKHNSGLIPVIVGCQTHFEIAIDGQSIAPQRMNADFTGTTIQNTLRRLFLPTDIFRV
jgi:hypothetical protein